MYEDNSIDGFFSKRTMSRPRVQVFKKQLLKNKRIQQKAVKQLVKADRRVQHQARKLGIPSPPPMVPPCLPGAPAIIPRSVITRPPPYPRGKKGFMAWMKDEHPAIFNRMAERAPVLIYGKEGLPGIKRDRDHDALDYEGYNYDTGNYLLYGLGAEAAPAKKEKTWADRIMDFASPLMQAYQQKQIFKAQLERAKRNLPPLKTDEMATQVKVKVEAGKGLTDTLSKMAMPIGIGVAAIFLLPKLMR